MLKGLVFAEAQLDPQLFGTNGAHSLRRRSQGLVAQLVGQGQDDLGTVVLRHVQDGSSETDLIASSPVSASPENKKHISRSERDLFRDGSSETDLIASSPASASPENKNSIQLRDGSSETDLSTSSPVSASPKNKKNI